MIMWTRLAKTAWAVAAAPLWFLGWLIPWAIGEIYFVAAIAAFVWLSYHPNAFDVIGLGSLLRLVLLPVLIVQFARVLPTLKEGVRFAWTRPLEDWEKVPTHWFFIAASVLAVVGVNLLVQPPAAWPAAFGIDPLKAVLRLFVFNPEAELPGFPMTIPVLPWQAVMGFSLGAASILALEGVRRGLGLPRPFRAPSFGKRAPREKKRGVRVFRRPKPVVEVYDPRTFTDRPTVPWQPDQAWHNQPPKGQSELQAQAQPQPQAEPQQAQPATQGGTMPEAKSEAEPEFRFVRVDGPEDEPEVPPAPKQEPRKRLTKEMVLAELRKRLYLPPETERKVVEVAILIADPEGFREKWGIEPPKGAVLWGPPGTGKTSIARFLADITGLNFMPISPANARGKWVGESAKMIREHYRNARAQAPALVFIDEADTIAGKRVSAASAADQEIVAAVNQLLQEVEGVRKTSRFVFTLAATNHPDDLDPAFRSRLSKDIPVMLPDLAGRRKILELHLGRLIKAGRVASDVDLDELADRAEGLSGRALERLVREAVNRVHADGREQIEMDDLIAALDWVFKEGE